MRPNQRGLIGHGYITHEQGELHYRIIGSGPKVMLAFHGFGQSGEVYRDMATLLGQEYTFYSIDLFFHGNSTWNDNELPISKLYWKNLLKALLQKHDIVDFSVIGFSIGAKLAIACLQSFPHRIKSLLLIAPEGIGHNLWYTVATQHPLRKYFKGFIERPQRFFTLLKWSDRLLPTNKSLLHFVKKQMDTKKKREQVYSTWMVFRRLHFTRDTITKVINKEGMLISMFLGENDKIIPPKRGKSWLKRLQNHELHLLPSRHQTLIQAVTNHIKNSKKAI